MDKITLKVVREKLPFFDDEIKDAVDAAEIAHVILHDEHQEVMLLLMVNEQLKLSGVYELARGKLNTTKQTLMDILKPIILCNCDRVILVHNHPSGDPTPSDVDIATNKRLKEKLALVDVELLDSIVVGSDSWISMVELEMI